MDGCWLREQDEGDCEEAFDPFDLVFSARFIADGWL